ncbi:archaetidylserine decarboxylase [Hydrogenophaga sp. PBL-H3]|uniref:archaetidylserine decarboxylase n=1 Tax=Hydrogenophaga sp. PBL-H3 TaxID=434010 RepID=UPI00131F9168|nr:archaetidylserine decarboxylase [Hydrogenophaga sp. PBL-H3]QHE77153.1 phosphatidylserine decarboxylase [Hydrogenophaga sp. PBL-H3]QHE81577.1 phosphatidylserine decarboxylase [Hydrogenophaga sp. PBL-H3]
MNINAWREKFLLNEDLNFLLTNRIPRVAATRFMGWFSRIRSPVLTRLSIAVWRLFTDLDLSEAKQQRFESLRDCFTRELKPGLRPFEPDLAVLCSPSDAIVGACGPIDGTDVLQAKGFPYPLQELLGSQAMAQRMQGGRYTTLRLTSAMYHRFHAPHALAVDRVTYISGDTWNVNPIALKRVERLFCKNERAVIECRLPTLGDAPLILVPVAAVLVASIRLHWLNILLHLRWPGPNVIPCSARMAKGEEMGWFEHGSTIIVLTPPGLVPVAGIESGVRIHAGQALFQQRTADATALACPG